MELDKPTGSFNNAGAADANLGNGGNVVWIATGYVKVGQPAFQIDRPTEKNNFTTTIKAGICKGCECVFESAQAVKKACCRCRHMMCADCAEDRKCSVCGRPVCPDCGDTWYNEWQCNDHI